jgi:hypothetical protein
VGPMADLIIVLAPKSKRWQQVISAQFGDNV